MLAALRAPIPNRQWLPGGPDQTREPTPIPIQRPARCLDCNEAGPAECARRDRLDVQLLIAEAKKQLLISRIDLFLLEGNQPAQNCYLNYGFQFLPNDFVITYQNNNYNILKMTIAV